MSASLVGSEMCIRDRCERSRGRRGPSSHGCLRGRRVEVGPGAAGRGGAVSYTHLTLPTICSV
eukprot:7154680-Alexandrium_andersonii.AAC.1